MSSSNILRSVEQSIRDFWVCGYELEAILAMCPNRPEVIRFVTEEYILLQSKYILANLEDSLKRLQ